jgi:hypothetical protein
MRDDQMDMLPSDDFGHHGPESFCPFQADTAGLNAANVCPLGQ